MYAKQIFLHDKLCFNRLKTNLINNGNKFSNFYHCQGYTPYKADSINYRQTYKSTLFTGSHQQLNNILQISTYQTSTVLRDINKSVKLNKDMSQEDKSQSVKSDNIPCDVKPNEQLSRAEKLKKAVKEYGSTVIIFHVTISIASLGICYMLVSSGFDLSSFLSSVGLNNELTNKLASNTGTFVAAYAVHKLFAPVRIGITLTATPFIVKHLRNIGWLRK